MNGKKLSEPELSPLYPYHVFVRTGPAEWPCLEDPGCGKNGSRSYYGSFADFSKYLQFQFIKEVPLGVEEEVPNVIFSSRDCHIPARGTLNDFFNTGFYLLASVILPGPETLFFGIRWNNADYMLGSTVAECTEYPCYGALEMSWALAEIPTVREFLELVGQEPKPGIYEYTWITGYGEGIVTDELPSMLVVERSKEESNLPIILAGTITAIGSLLTL